jgi:hypothetical protein
MLMDHLLYDPSPPEISQAPTRHKGSEIPAPNVAAPAVRHAHEQRIRERAYFIWKNEGCPEGRHELHWWLASCDIDREDTGVARPSRRRSPWFFDDPH